jgi:hypothetical protein
MTVAPEALIRALKPIYSRVRKDVTAVKYQGRQAWTRDALNLERMLQHVTGGTARGVCPILEGECTTRLGLLDFDSHGGETPWHEMVAVADRVVDGLTAVGLQPIAFRSSGGRGIHLFVLWDEPQDAYSVRQALTDVLGGLGLKNGAKGVSRGEVEVFPKQNAVGVGEFGNQFILPLAGKSEPLDILFGFEPMGRDGVLRMDWPVSVPVERREAPVRQVAASEGVEPLDKLRSALFSIPNDGLDPATPDYFKWRDLGFALHEATGGSQDGLELFLEWSEQNPLFERQFTIDRVWDYIKPAAERGGGGITRGTLYHAASTCGWNSAPVPDAEGFDDVPQEQMAQAVALIEADKHEAQALKHEAKSKWKRAVMEAADAIALQEEVCTGIAAEHRLDKVDREMLAEAVRIRFAAFGDKLGIAVCRKLVAPAKRAEKKAPGAKQWTDDWVYITDQDTFYRIDSEEFLTAQGFNAKFNRMLPPAAEGELPKSAHRVALDEMHLPTVTKAMYLPWAGPTFEAVGVQYVNLYRPSSTPKAASVFTPQGREAIRLVEKHLALLAGGRKDVVEILKSWMAHNVQNPGVKIRWAPLIKGIEGDGKSLIGRIMASVMGQANVKDISPKVLGTDFTGWATGACIGVLEEIRLTGHSRHDILNALKPFITNPTVPIHAKGKDEFNAENTMNYIAFTNHADALPLNNNDRRWWVLFTPFTTLEQLVQAVEGNAEQYFDVLFDAIAGNPEELRKWLLEMPISKLFKADGRAPGSAEKDLMVGLSVSDEEDAVKEALKTGGFGITENVVVMHHLRTAVNEIDPELADSPNSGGKQIARILSRLGWFKSPGKVKWRAQVCNVWHKGLGLNPEPQLLRKVLDDAAGNSADEDLF